MRPESAATPERTEISNYKSRIGVRMCLLYTVVYGGFVTVNTFWPTLMDLTVGGLNLALLYGFGLIVFAFLLACVYNQLCTAVERRPRR